MTKTIDDLTLDITQEIEIKAAPGDTFRAMLGQLADIRPRPDADSMNMVLEEWPGGRWFRDLGQGQGHLWGFVQVIKPPTLLEIAGPMFMSYAAAGHLQLRLAPIAGGTLVTLRHCAVGMIDEQHRQGVNDGWQKILEQIKQAAEK
jgi:hypothetical protein